MLEAREGFAKSVAVQITAKALASVIYLVYSKVFLVDTGLVFKL